MSHSSDGDGKGVPFSPALHQALLSADAKHRASLDVLQDAICEYVEDLRDRGVSTDHIASAIRLRITHLQSSDCGDCQAASEGGRFEGASRRALGLNLRAVSRDGYLGPRACQL